MDLTYNLGGKWGLVGFSQGSSVVSAPSIGTGVPGNLGNITTENPGLSMTGGYGSILDDLQVSFILRATQARSDSESLAAPRVTVMSGESASFSLWDMVSYALPPTRTQGFVTSQSGTTTGTTQGTYQNVNFLPVGSTLGITPTISKDKKYVLLNIQTQQVELLGFATHEVANTDDDDDDDTSGEPNTYIVDVPETETANVMTRVSVPDGGTLLLGGHKVAARVERESGVPVLSKIPVIGALFSNRSKMRDQRVLLIFVKPTIIIPEEKEQDAIAAMEEGTGDYQLQY
jgi:type II secretory pathway component GspD/PulD (secretin)